MTEKKNNRTGLMHRALTAAPVIVGTGIGLSSLFSNRSSTLSSLKTGDLSSIGNTVGNNIHNLQARNEKISIEKLNGFRESLTQSGKIKEILSRSSEERKAIVAAVLNIIDNPNSGLEIESRTTSIRESLMKLLEKEGNDILEEEEKMLSNIIETVFQTGSESTKRKLSNNIRDFTNYRRVLSSPLPINLQGLSAGFNEIDLTDLSPSQKSLVDNIQRSIEHSPDSVVKVYKGKLAGQEIVEARVFKNKSERTLKSSNYFQINLSNNQVVRIGQGSTSYSPARGYANLSSLTSGLNQYKGHHSNAYHFLETSGAIRNFAEFSVDTFVSMVGRGGINALKFKDFHNTLTEVTDQVPRAGRANSTVDPLYASFYNRSLNLNRQQIVVSGIETLNPSEQRTIRANLATKYIDIFDSAGDPLTTRTESGGSHIRLGLKASGTLDVLNRITTKGNYNVDRFLHPVTAREKQFLGRDSMFVKKGAPSSSWGYTRRAMILDVNDDALIRLGLGEGEALVGGMENDLVRTNITKTVSNPFVNKHQSTELLNELIYLRSENKILEVGQQEYTIQTGRNKGKTINSVDDFFRYFGSKVDDMAVLGFGEGNQAIGLARYQGLQAFKLGIEETTDNNEKSLFHIAGTIDLYSPNNKLFGPLFKGTSQTMNDRAYNKIRGIRVGKGNLGRILDNLKVTRDNLLVSEGSMLKKSPVYMAHQVAGAMRLIGGRSLEQALETNMSSVRSAEEVADLLTLPADKYRKAYLEDLTKAAALTIGSFTGNISEDTIGMIFGGLKTVVKDDSAFKDLISTPLGSKYNVDKIIDTAKQGYVLAESMLAPGPAAAISRRNMSSMEPRTFSFLANRLKAQGSTEEEIASVINSLITSKSGIDSELKRADVLTRMVESLGHGSKLTDVNMLNLPTVSMEEFISSSGDETSMKRFLQDKRFEEGKGFMLNLDEETSAILKKKNIFIGAGDNFISSFADTEIRGKEQSKIIESDYVRRVHHFASDILVLRRAQDSASLARAQEQILSFKDDIGEIWAGTFKGILKGRLRGSAQAVGAAISLGVEGANPLYASELKDIKNASLNYSEAEIEAAREVGKARKGLAKMGNYAFADTEVFLSAMSTFYSGEKDNLISQGTSDQAASKIAKADAVTMTQRFFLGMEGERKEGITALTIRNPQLAATHINPIEVYRNVGEIGERDKYFDLFTNTRPGREALEVLEEETKTKISSFGDINKVTSKKAKYKFFEAMFDNITNFSTGEGLGRLSFPTMEVDVNYGSGIKRRIDMSVSAGMIGDFDGDTYQMLLMGKSSRDVLNKVTNESSELEIMRRFTTRIFTEETKSGIRNFAVGLSSGELSVTEDAYESALKERIGKDVGRLDVALDRLRMGVVALPQADHAREMHMQQSLSVLTALEEISLKAKKAPRGIEINEALTNVIDNFIDKGQSQEFDLFVRRTLFKGTDLEQGAIKIDSLDLSAVPSEARQHIGKLVGQEISLTPIFDILKEASVRSREIGADTVKTVRQLARGATRAEYYDSYQAAVVNGNSPQGAMLNGYRAAADASGIEEVSQAINRNIERVKRFNSTGQRAFNRMAVPLVAGAVASFGVGILTNSSGYSSTPLVAPGDFTDSIASASIMAGTATDSKVPVESIPQHSQVDISNRPINIGNATMTQNNNFQMKGEIGSYAGIGSTMNLMNRLGSQGHITINDTRRPMSKHYLNRTFGE